jgi:hypothetical protein
VALAKHGCIVVVVMAVEEFERLKEIEQRTKPRALHRQGKADDQ